MQHMSRINEWQGCMIMAVYGCYGSGRNTYGDSDNNDISDIHQYSMILGMIIPALLKGLSQ